MIGELLWSSPFSADSTMLKSGELVDVKSLEYVTAIVAPDEM
jgi:hypothetical protein